MIQRLKLVLLSATMTLTTITGCTASAETGLTTSNDSKFQVGQVWRYTTRPGEEDSTLIIVKVEYDEKIGNIIHISINGLKISNPKVEGGINEEVPHMPISEDALGASVVELIDEGVDLPSFEEGYNAWRSATGGVFTIPVSEVVEVIEQALNQ